MSVTLTQHKVAPWAVASLAMFANAWGGNQFSPLLVLFKQQGGYSAFEVNAFLGVYVFGLAPALLIAGPVADRLGRRPVAIAGILLSILASGILIFSPLGAVPIFIGRFLCGATIGVSMAALSTWIKELSEAPFERVAVGSGAGAKRSSVAFTLGTGAGALVAGALAQWTPLGMTMPFIVHILFAVPALVLAWRLPETLVAATVEAVREGRSASWHPRLWKVVQVAGPWVFVAAGVGYGYIPVLLAPASGELGIAYAALLCLIAQLAAAGVQPLMRRVHSTTSARGLMLMLLVVLIGIAFTVVAVLEQSLLLGGVAAAVLGAAFGAGMVLCLLEVQAIAPPRELARVTGVFYAWSYFGFLMPTVLALIVQLWNVPVFELFLGLGVLCVASLIVVWSFSTRNLPADELVEETERHLAGE